MRDQVCQNFNNNKLLKKNQYGFRKNFKSLNPYYFAQYSSKTKLTLTVLSQQHFLDLSKTYDSINYAILDIKLGNLISDESSKKLLRIFVTNRRQSVILQDCISDELMLHKGVPQGTVFGLLLFNPYNVNIATRVDNKTELIQCADNTVILTFDTSTDKSNIRLEQIANKFF